MAKNVLFNGVTLTNYLCDDEISTDDTGTATVTFLGIYIYNGRKVVIK